MDHNRVQVGDIRAGFEIEPERDGQRSFERRHIDMGGLTVQIEITNNDFQLGGPAIPAPQLSVLDHGIQNFLDRSRFPGRQRTRMRRAILRYRELHGVKSAQPGAQWFYCFIVGSAVTHLKNVTLLSLYHNLEQAAQLPPPLLDSNSGPGAEDIVTPRHGAPVMNFVFQLGNGAADVDSLPDPEGSLADPMLYRARDDLLDGTLSRRCNRYGR